MDNNSPPKRNREYPFADIWPALRNTELSAVHKITPPNDPTMPLAVQSLARRVWDTWHAGPTPAAMPTDGWRALNQPYSAPAVVRLRAVQIKVRVYDTKNHLTRQITVVQEL